MTVLTLDLGTSATKAAIWGDEGVVALARAPIATRHSQPGWAEQDAEAWWDSVLSACSEVRSAAPDTFGAVEAVGFAAARETFALFDESLTPIGPGILWSDQRATAQLETLGDAEVFRSATGVTITPGSHAAKLAWIIDNDPRELDAARWVLAPRDFVIARLTGAVVTDETLASRTGLCALGGWWLPEAVQRYRERLPEIVPSTRIVGVVKTDVALQIGLRDDVHVVAGAGDRTCEVLGTGATAHAPMVSWGTTANVSVPHSGPIEALPAVAQVSRGALGGFVVEAGLSAAGAAIAWVAQLTGCSHDDLLAAAAEVPPGARGAVALPWFAGARAPWWHADAHAAFVGLTDAHGPAELARAVVEGVAFDVARCLELITPDAEELALAGGGAGDELWRNVVAAVTGRPVVRRALDDAASVGARLVVASALGEDLELEALNPVAVREEPDSGSIRDYAALRGTADAVASAVINLS